MQRRRMIDRPNQVQGKNWIAVIWGVILLIVGFGTIMSISVGIGAVWTAFAVILIVNGVRKALAPKNASKLDDSVEEVVSRIQNKGKKTVRSKQETHDHIPSTALDVEARLEQLRSLKEAGLLDNAEYEQRKQKLFKGQ